MRKRATSRRSTDYQGEPAVLTKIGRRTARSAIARSAPPPPTPARPGAYPPPAGLAFFLLILVKLPFPWYDKLTFYIDRRFFHYVRREKNPPAQRNPRGIHLEHRRHLPLRPGLGGGVRPGPGPGSHPPQLSGAAGRERRYPVRIPHPLGGGRGPGVQPAPLRLPPPRRRHPSRPISSDGRQGHQPLCGADLLHRLRHPGAAQAVPGDLGAVLCRKAGAGAVPPVLHRPPGSKRAHPVRQGGKAAGRRRGDGPGSLRDFFQIHLRRPDLSRCGGRERQPPAPVQRLLCPLRDERRPGPAPLRLRALLRHPGAVQKHHRRSVERRGQGALLRLYRPKVRLPPDCRRKRQPGTPGGLPQPGGHGERQPGQNAPIRPPAQEAAWPGRAAYVRYLRPHGGRRVQNHLL